jgi:hypothetical protein
MKKSKTKPDKPEPKPVETPAVPQNQDPDFSYIWVKDFNKKLIGGLHKEKTIQIFNEELQKEVVLNTVVRQILKQNNLDWETTLVNRIKKRLEENWTELFKKDV